MADEPALLRGDELAFSTLCENIKAAKSAANWIACLILIWIGAEIARFSSNKINGVVIFFFLVAWLIGKIYFTRILLKSIEDKHFGKRRNKIRNMLTFGWTLTGISLFLVVITLVESDAHVVYVWLLIFVMQGITLGGFIYTASKIGKFLNKTERNWRSEDAEAAADG